MANPFILRSEYIPTSTDEARRAEIISELDPKDLARIRGGTNNWDMDRITDWHDEKGPDRNGTFDTDS